MKAKRVILLLVLSFLIGFISLNSVYAISLDEDVINDNSTIVKIVSDKAIIMGSLTGDLVAENVWDSFNLEALSEYGISGVTVMDNEESLEYDALVKSDQLLILTGDNDQEYSYTIVVVGDLNSDGVVNEDDVDLLIDEILLSEEDDEEEEVNVSTDINGDGNIYVDDVTHMTYSIDKGSWGIGQVELEDILSSLNADDVVYVDDTVEVIYKISGFNVGTFKGISGLLTYDKSLLELDSIFVNSIYGYLNSDGKFLYVFDDSLEGDTLITFSFKVTSRGEGSTTVSLSDLKAAIDGVSIELDQESLDKGMQIEEYGKGGDVESSEEETTSEEVVTTPSLISYVTPTNNSYSSYVMDYVSLSGNNFIKSLEIKNYKIDFDMETLDYEITVGNNVDSLDLTVILDDEKATYSVIGNENFKTGKNMVTIEVKAEDGSVRNYVITVNKKGIPYKKNKDNNTLKYVSAGLIVLVIAGLVYVIFKDDDEENKGSKK